MTTIPAIRDEDRAMDDLVKAMDVLAGILDDESETLLKKGPVSIDAFIPLKMEAGRRLEAAAQAVESLGPDAADALKARVGPSARRLEAAATRSNERLQQAIKVAGTLRALIEKAIARSRSDGVYGKDGSVDNRTGVRRGVARGTI